MFPGAVLSWWVYFTDRLAGDSHRQAMIDTLAAMEGWSSTLNFSPHVGRAAHDALGHGAAAYKRRCLTSRAVLRFHIPLIDPDVRVSRAPLGLIDVADIHLLLEL